MNLDRTIGKLERSKERFEGKIEKLKMRHAHALMNEARELLGKAPKRYARARKGTRTSNPAKMSKGHAPTFSGKKV